MSSELTDSYEYAKGLIRILKERDPDSDAYQEAFRAIAGLLLKLDELTPHHRSPDHFRPRWSLVIKAYIREMTHDMTPSKLRREMVSRLTLAIVYAIGLQRERSMT